MDIVSTLTVTRGPRIDGGQGQNCLGVFRARDPQLGMDVALKEISKTGRDATSFFAEAQRMFESEHPNVVPIRTASQTATSILLVMPLYERGSLATRIASQPLSIHDTIRVGREILAGVGAIHAGSSVHFDIKPSNVLIGDNGAAKVADFGQARELGPDGFTLMPERMYAPLVPPEAFTTNGVGSRLSDIFQVGATLYRAVNGEPFFEAQLARLAGQVDLQDAIMRGRFPDRNKFLPHVPRGLKRIIRKAMNTTDTDRYQTADEFSTALAKVLPTLNWSPALQPDGNAIWEADRSERPNLRVELSRAGSHFDVKLSTSSLSGIRATKKGFWRLGMNRKDTDTYLSQLFDSLE
jgi:eukaryotic-like serine/threonine-protein kinase